MADYRLQDFAVDCWLRSDISLRYCTGDTLSADVAEMEDIPWALIIPIALIQISLAVIALIDLSRRAEVIGPPKWAWAIIILIFGLAGPIAYLVAGRKED